MLDLRRLRYFVTVAEELHFGRAALRLQIAQPPLTRHITALEADLGIRLFDRSTRAVSLTPEGIRFLEQARKVVDAVRNAEDTARKLASGSAGRIVIGYTSSVPMSDAFPALFGHASSVLPDVELVFREVPTASQPQQLADGTLDIGFGWTSSKFADRGIRSLVLVRSRFVAVVPSQSPYASRTAIAFAELAQEPFISYPPGYGAALNMAMDDLCARTGVSPRMGPTASQITTLVSLVAAQRGVAIAPDYVVSLRRPEVAYVPLVESPVMEQRISWVEPFSSRCVARFVEIAQTMKNAPEADQGGSPVLGA